MTKQQEKLLSKKLKKTIAEARFHGLKAGATGILGAILDMCNEGKSVDDIRQFCEKSLVMDGMK